MEKQKTTRIIIGYMPLLYGDRIYNGIAHSKKESIDLINKISSLEHPGVRACLWASGDKTVYPVFLVEKAKEIVDHIKWYSEGKPDEWFSICVNKTKKSYDVALFPNMKKTIERFKLKVLMVDAELIDDSDDYRVIFCPLHFHSDGPGMINKIKIEDKLKLGIVDIKDINVDDIKKGDYSSIPTPDIIGEFKIDPKFKSWFKNKK